MRSKKSHEALEFLLKEEVKISKEAMPLHCAFLINIAVRWYKFTVGMMSSSN